MLACSEPSISGVPYAWLNESRVEIANFVLPTVLGGHTQGERSVVGLAIECGKLAVQPLVQLCFGKALAEKVVMGLGLAQG
ncbi:hypothetical protein D3C84_726280 [compost metagenome]